MHHGANKSNELDNYCVVDHVYHPGDRFGRLFPNLPALYTSPEVIADIGKHNGAMQDQDSPVATSSVDVGLVFFGQFIDHDITLDVSSSLSANNDSSEIDNVRTPSLDLDCIYESGPEASAHLYYQKDDFKGIKLLTGNDAPDANNKGGSGLKKSDLARSYHGTAIIGDPRNDENRIISQLQLSMIRLHNKVVDELHARDHIQDDLYEAAKEAVVWHYQWAVVNDLLVKLCGKAVINRILGQGRKYFCSSHGIPFIPVEFSVAAYRFGHSMIPQKIQVQKDHGKLDLFGSILGEGFSPLENPEAIVDWNQLLDNQTGHSVQKANKLDLKLAEILLNLPFIDSPDEKSLASRNIFRGQSFFLPSGESIAGLMKRPEAEIQTVSDRVSSLTTGNLDSGSPLWLYILAEAETIGRESTPGHFEPGEGLGPIGATIVAETLIGLIELDEYSWLGTNRNWTPDNEHEGGLGIKTVGELLTFAGPVYDL